MTELNNVCLDEELGYGTCKKRAISKCIHECAFALMTCHVQELGQAVIIEKVIASFLPIFTICIMCFGKICM